MEDEYIPIRLLKDAKKIRADVWESSFGKQNFVKRIAGKDDVSAFTAGIVYDTLKKWRIDKEVFTFDGDVEQSLYDTEETDIDLSVLNALPFQTFYIETKNVIVNKERQHGFFVSVDDCRVYFILVFENLNQLHFVFDKTKAKTLNKAINDTNQSVKAKKQLHRLLCGLFQLVLYICASNSDIEENRKQKIRYKRTAKTHDKFSEIRKWDVGYRIGYTIRSSQSAGNDNQSNAASSHNSPRAHVRRAHWHHFWKNDPQVYGKKKLILKWLFPTFVNWGNDEDGDNNPMTVHKVKK